MSRANSCCRVNTCRRLWLEEKFPDNKPLVSPKGTPERARADDLNRLGGGAAKLILIETRLTTRGCLVGASPLVSKQSSYSCGIKVFEFQTCCLSNSNVADFRTYCLSNSNVAAFQTLPPFKCKHHVCVATPRASVVRPMVGHRLFLRDFIKAHLRKIRAFALFLLVG